MLRNPSSNWPNTPALQFTPRGVLNLLSQDPTIRDLIRCTFTKITGDALFINAFPDVGDRLKYARDALYSIGKDLGLREICERLKVDEVYSKEISRVADARWTDTRRSFKHSAIPACIHGFDLKVRCATRVQALLASAHTDYIYPQKDGAVDYNKPFSNPAIIATMHQTIFLGRRPLATVYQSWFRLTDGAAPEWMMSPVIASVAATAVCAMLQDWQGPQCINTEFNANLYAETYLGHMSFGGPVTCCLPEGTKSIVS
ncbi:hypothetical protein B0H10DRAFT_523196 [Mycena sp. CBHHK59/15]|nr:hypothetical protein B0H10DRAFT_523196 [Mycena sp. CBHHK59/15]